MFTGYITKFLLPFSQSNSFELPIGTILPYVGDLADIPKGWYLCDGSNGTPNLTGRFLEGTTTKANIFVEAGLPNITGTYNTNGIWSGFLNGENATQAFSIQKTSSTPWGGYDGDYGYVGILSFSAERCSSIYGNSNTVQPPAYTVYYIIKVIQPL